jgi:hypothetical protein
MDDRDQKLAQTVVRALLMIVVAICERYDIPVPGRQRSR